MATSAWGYNDGRDSPSEEGNNSNVPLKPELLPLCPSIYLERCLAEAVRHVCKEAACPALIGMAVRCV